MLVLTRKPGEALMLADEVKITVLEVKGKQVRLGIEAPADVAVHREEIYRRIEAERATDGTNGANGRSKDGDEPQVEAISAN